MTKWADLPETELAMRYRAGASTIALGRLCGVSERTIASHLRRAGVELRPNGWQRGHNYSPGGPRKLGGPLSTGRGYLLTRSRNGKKCRVHRACREAIAGPIPRGNVVHHVNGDVKDNRIENLVCMSNSDHARLHAARRAQDALKLEERVKDEDAER